MTTSDPSDEGSPPQRGQPELWSALGETEPWPAPEDGTDPSGPGPGQVADTTRGEMPEEALAAPPPTHRTAGSSPDETPTAPQPPLPGRQPATDAMVPPLGPGGAAEATRPGPGTPPQPTSPGAMYPPTPPEPGLSGGRIALVIGLVAAFLACCLAGAVGVALTRGSDLYQQIRNRLDIGLDDGPVHGCGCEVVEYGLNDSRR